MKKKNTSKYVLDSFELYKLDSGYQLSAPLGLLWRAGVQRRRHWRKLLWFIHTRSHSIGQVDSTPFVVKYNELLSRFVIGLAWRTFTINIIMFEVNSEFKYLVMSLHSVHSLNVYAKLKLKTFATDNSLMCVWTVHRVQRRNMSSEFSSNSEANNNKIMLWEDWRYHNTCT